jgi:proton-dependent oligopeptide transporter, POT family
MTSTESEVVKSDKYPSAIPYIIGNEAAERFSFYGMRSILPIFLVAQFFNPSGNPALQAVAEAKSNEQTHLFVSLAYFTPIIGAIMADWFFGKYKVILYISIVYCIGHLFLAKFDTDLTWFGYGLTLRLVQEV